MKILTIIQEGFLESVRVQNSIHQKKSPHKRVVTHFIYLFYRST